MNGDKKESERIIDELQERIKERDYRIKQLQDKLK